MKKIEVELTDRLYQQIVDFCDFNRFSLKTYIRDKIEEGFSIDRFGDLNVLTNQNVSNGVERKQREDIEEKFEKNVITKAVFQNETKQIVITDINNKEYRIDIDSIPTVIEEGIVLSEEKTNSIENDEKKPKIRKREIKSK